MFTRVTIQGSLVALQQHIRAKGPSTTTRERSHSLEEPDRRSGKNAISNALHTTTASAISTTTPPRLPTANQTSAMKEHHQQQQHAVTHNVIREEEEEAEVILAYDGVPVSDAPSATYHFGEREVVIHNVCAFLELWLNSFKSHNYFNQCNPHGWECLRRRQNDGSNPSCHSNSHNNFNTAHASCGHPLHYVYGTTIPTIGMKDYLLRLTEYFRTSDSVFIVAAQYFSRVVNAYQDKLQNDPNYQGQHENIITPWSLHRVYFSCCVLAAKWLEDTPFDNQYYASVGGISTFELSAVETELLKLLDFNIFVSRGTVDEAWEELQQLGAAAGRGINMMDLQNSCNVLTIPTQYHSHTSSSSEYSYAPLSVDATPFRPSTAPQQPTSSGINNSWYRGASVMPTYHHPYQYQYHYGQPAIASIVGGYASASN
eukprot:GILI01001913.1.p1 GENE.GILI01001913.1~~GILI01001913.1.p1  ORF type:complete len:428 (+),score=66.77 GILI01001913.1:72-1355(+)